ncbi:MAG: phosphate ABC transporter permease subunit PstC [Candidatus Omnitrophica bacterium]|nr:phosphate ABC transporter permease subunit PstC [Candidatus Omnitrophota bacterium]
MNNGNAGNTAENLKNYRNDSLSIPKVQHGDVVFKRFLFLSGLGVLILFLAIGISLVLNSLPSIRAFGFNFFVTKSWSPPAEQFGALPFIAGTLLTSFIAIIITVPFSIAISIFTGEFYKEGFLSNLLKSMIELLAGIPSVVYGFFGLFVLVPVMRIFEIKIGVLPYGVGIFTASLILSVMIIPFSASIGREVINMVPADIKEAAYSLGGTRYEVVRSAVIPYAKSGIFAGILLALGRALGETMAVTMIIGNADFLPHSIFSPANTMASVIANEFTEATGTLYLSSLIEIGVVLFIITGIINIIGRIIIKKLMVET